MRVNFHAAHPRCQLKPPADIAIQPEFNMNAFVLSLASSVAAGESRASLAVHRCAPPPLLIFLPSGLSAIRSGNEIHQLEIPLTDAEAN